MLLTSCDKERKEPVDPQTPTEEPKEKEPKTPKEEQKIEISLQIKGKTIQIAEEKGKLALDESLKEFKGKDVELLTIKGSLLAKETLTLSRITSSLQALTSQSQHLLSVMPTMALRTLSDLKSLSYRRTSLA